MFTCTKLDFHIFEQKPIQTAVLETRERKYKPVGTVDQTDLEFVVHGDNETYIDPNIHIYIKGKLVKNDDGFSRNRPHDFREQLASFAF
jgi:hypothetical protein